MGAQQVSLSAVASRVWEIYRDQAGVLLGVAVILFAVQFLVNLALSAAAGISSRCCSGSSARCTRGWSSRLVQDVQDGSAITPSASCYRASNPCCCRCWRVGVLFAIGVGIGFILLIVPGLYLMTIWCVVAPATVIEHPGVFAAFRRSRELVRGYGWAVFGVILGIFFAVVLVSIIAGLAASGLGTVGRSPRAVGRRHGGRAGGRARGDGAVLHAAPGTRRDGCGCGRTFARAARLTRPHRSPRALVLGSRFADNRSADQQRGPEQERAWRLTHRCNSE